MPVRLSLRATLVMVGLAFGVAFVIQALLAAGSSAAKPAARQSAPAPKAVVPATEPDLALAAAGRVPALQDPRKPARRKKKPSVRTAVKKAPKADPPPVVSATPVPPAPTATPRYTPPAPQRSTPKPKPAAPKPKPKPAPTSTPQTSGGFDSSGDGGS